MLDPIRDFFTHHKYDTKKCLAIGNLVKNRFAIMTVKTKMALAHF